MQVVFVDVFSSSIVPMAVQWVLCILHTHFVFVSRKSFEFFLRTCSFQSPTPIHTPTRPNDHSFQSGFPYCQIYVWSLPRLGAGPNYTGVIPATPSSLNAALEGFPKLSHKFVFISGVALTSAIYRIVIER